MPNKRGFLSDMCWKLLSSLLQKEILQIIELDYVLSMLKCKKNVPKSETMSLANLFIIHLRWLGR